MLFSRFPQAFSAVVAAMITLGYTTASYAETIVYRAADDFSNTDAGEAPYYVHFSAVPIAIDTPYRDALAIDASMEENRNVFARATTQHTGTSGYFDVTIIGLAELDGEADYRLLVNDLEMGTARNPEVDVDYTPVRHTFENIIVPEGATLAVESLANTNGKIPEGNGTAFARGRWTALELFREDDPQDNAAQVDLSINARVSDASAVVGDQVILSVDISNTSEQTVATGPVLSLTRPRAEVGVISLGQCTTQGNDVNCPLSEIAAGDTVSIMLTLEMLQATPSAMLRVAVESDQIELTPDDNTINVTLGIDMQSPDPAVAGENEPTGDADSANTGDMASENTDNSGMSGSGSGAVSWFDMLALAVIGALVSVRRRRIFH